MNFNNVGSMTKNKKTHWLLLVAYLMSYTAPPYNATSYSSDSLHWLDFTSHNVQLVFPKIEIMDVISQKIHSKLVAYTLFHRGTLLKNLFHLFLHSWFTVHYFSPPNIFMQLLKFNIHLTFIRIWQNQLSPKLIKLLLLRDKRYRISHFNLAYRTK